MTWPYASKSSGRSAGRSSSRMMRCICARPPALQALERVAVEEQLEDVARQGMTAELRVVDLVGPVAEGGGLVDADEEVRIADPAVVGEAPLVDDPAPGSHRVDRAPRALGGGRLVVLDREHVAPLRAQSREDVPLVAPAPFEQQIHPRRPALGIEVSAPFEDVEVGAVLAAEEAVERARGQMRMGHHGQCRHDGAVS